MAEVRHFVTVDIHGGFDQRRHEQFMAKHRDASMAPLRQGGGFSYYLPVFTTDESKAGSQVERSARQIFPSPWVVTIRKVERSPM